MNFQSFHFDRYMAPEIRQQKEYGFPVDLWSCGVLMYVISSGTLPFARERQDFLPTEMSVVDLRAKYSVKFTGSKWPKISANAKSLVSALLEVDPLLRLSSNNALHHEWVLSCFFYCIFEVKYTIRSSYNFFLVVSP